MRDDTAGSNKMLIFTLHNRIARVAPKYLNNHQDLINDLFCQTWDQRRDYYLANLMYVQAGTWELM